jgi:hypothetical protein
MLDNLADSTYSGGCDPAIKTVCHVGMWGELLHKFIILKHIFCSRLGQLTMLSQPIGNKRNRNLLALTNNIPGIRFKVLVQFLGFLHIGLVTGLHRFEYTWVNQEV